MLYDARLGVPPSTSEITPGTISIDRKAAGGTSWTNVVNDAACSEAIGLIYYDEVFDSATGYAEGDSIRITFKSQSIIMSGRVHEITQSAGTIFYTSIRQTMRGTDNAALAATALTDATWTDARAGYLDNLSAGAVAQSSVCTDARLAELDAGNMPTDIANIETDTQDIQSKIGTPANIDTGGATLADNLKKLADDNAGADFDATNHSQKAIRDRGDVAWTTGSGTGLTALASGTAQGGTASTIQLAAGESFANDELNGNIVLIHTGTGAGQARLITDYTGATDTADVTPNWTTTPDATSQYEVIPGSMNVEQIVRVDATDQIRDAVVDDATRIDASALNTLSGHDPGATIAKAGDAMTLADDAITSAKYDETTAYPIKSEDAGNTQIARTGADGDTLETISDEIDDIETAATAIQAKTDNLPDGIQKNTALNNFEFVMYDSTDHITGKIGLTVTATRSIDGAAFGACANAVSEVANGVYKINLAAADLNGDVITLRFTAVGADDTMITIKTDS
jgi:hypothetical protein